MEMNKDLLVEIERISFNVLRMSGIHKKHCEKVSIKLSRLILKLIGREKIKSQKSLLAEIIEHSINNAGYDYPFEVKAEQLQRQLEEGGE